MEIIGKALENAISDINLLKAFARIIRKAFSDKNHSTIIQHCVKLEFIPKLNILSHIEDEKLQIDALWSLSNIAAQEDEEYIETILKLDIHNFALKLMRNGSKEIKEQCLWLIANIIGDKIKYRDIILETSLLSQITDILSKKTVPTMILMNIVWIISNICKLKPAPKYEKVFF